MWKNIVMFFAGFCLYITMEVCFRGYSFPLCGVLGGLALILIDKINNRISWDLDLSIQALLGSLLITGLELVFGSIAKYTPLLPIMWDYSNLPANFAGIICLPFSALWILISVVAIFFADAINYYVFNDPVRPYYRLFGKKFYFIER